MSRILPILFNTDMVQAILREPPNNKTATRRIIKGHIPDDAQFGYTMFTPEGHISCRGYKGPFCHFEQFHKLPCQEGDILYVRESYCELSSGYEYRADGITIDHLGNRIKWRPSIHMPKEAARIWLRVTDVRVERLNVMTLDDFLAEGVTLRPEAFNDPENAYLRAREQFKGIWDAMLKPAERGQYGWEANPWDWAISFERCEKPEVELGREIWRD